MTRPEMKKYILGKFSSKNIKISDEEIEPLVGRFSFNFEPIENLDEEIKTIISLKIQEKKESSLKNRKTKGKIYSALNKLKFSMSISEVNFLSKIFAKKNLTDAGVESEIKKHITNMDPFSRNTKVEFRDSTHFQTRFKQLRESHK